MAKKIIEFIAHALTGLQEGSNVRENQYQKWSRGTKKNSVNSRGKTDRIYSFLGTLCQEIRDL